MSLLRSKKGNIVETLLSLKVIIPVIFLVFFVFMFCVTKLNLANIKHIALEKMEVEGGYNVVVENKIRNYCDDHGIDFSNLVITATPAPQNYNTELSFNIVYQYSFNSIVQIQLIDMQESGYVSSERVIR